MSSLHRLWPVVVSVLAALDPASTSGGAQEAKASSGDQDAPYKRMELELHKVASIFSQISVDAVPDPKGGSSYQVVSKLNHSEWTRIDPQVATLRNALKAAGEPANNKEKAVRETARAIILLRDQKYDEAAKILTGDSIVSFLRELSQNATLGGNIYLFRGLLAEREENWLEAVKNYELAERYETEESDGWRRRWRCYSQLAAQFHRENKDGDALKYKRKAEDELIERAKEMDLKVLNFEGELKGDGLPPSWTRFDFVLGSKVEFVRKDHQPTELKITTDSSSVAVGLPIRINLKNTPFVGWEWRPDVMPPLGDVRAADTDDQACQIVFAFIYRGLFYLLNYGWDTNAPVGTIIARDVTRGGVPCTMFYYVVRSGPYMGPRDELVRESDRNIKGDLERIFNAINIRSIIGQDIKEVDWDEIRFMGVAAMGNTQHSKSRSAGVFGRIWLLDLGD